MKRASTSVRAVCLFLMGLGSLLLPVTAVGAAHAHSTPALQLSSTAAYPVVVSGSGFQPRQRVIFTVTELSITQGAQVITDKKGAFSVGLTGVNMCAQPLFSANAFRRKPVSIHVTWLDCAMPASVPPPSLTVLKGTAATPTTYKVIGLEPKSIIMHVDDELYIWESGTDSPAWRPHADETYLQLLDQGTTPPRMCPQVDCDQGFYWRYVAIRAGDTGVGMSAACRDSSPPCMVPDFLISVKILPVEKPKR